MKLFYLYIVSACLWLNIVSFAQNDSSWTNNLSSVKFSIVGDVMAHQTQLNYSRQPDSLYDFNPVFRFIKPYIDSADFAIANFETACAGDYAEYKGYPVFNTPDTLIGSLKYAGFDLLLTANNHLLDMGPDGARRTMNEIKRRGLLYNGSNLTPYEQDVIKTYVIKGIRFAFLSYTYFSNFNNVGGADYILNKIDLTRVKADIEKAKKESPDLIMVYYHFGTEELREPDDNQVEIVEKTIEFGADIILGGHPHRLQPIKLFETSKSKLDTGFVVYSMGNFVSNQRWRYNDAGALLNFTLEKDNLTNRVKLKSIDYIPTWVFKGNTEFGKEFIVLPSEMALEGNYPPFITDADKKLMEESYFDCIESFNKYSVFPKVLDLFQMSDK